MAERPAPLLVRAFDGSAVAEIRHAVARLAAAVGLVGRRLEDYVLAVNEIVTNAVRHAGGAGTVTVWSADGSLHCEVVDRGPGFPGRRPGGFHPPPALALGGRGVWLARHLCDELTVHTGPSGTTVVLRTTV